MVGGAALEIAVLGPVELRRDGERIAVRPGKTTEVLVRLALEAGVLVRTERLIEDLWADEAVGTGRNTLQSKISPLRRALGDASLVAGSSEGYTLHVEPDAVDALAVLRQAELAVERRDAGDAAAALDLASSALARFGGDVLPGAGTGDWAVPHRVRLEEARLVLTEVQLGARLDLGGAGELVGELEALVRDHPLREGFWVQLMTALYRDGRQADALAAYSRVREVLAEELGLDPGPALQTLEQRVLLQDPMLDAARDRAGTRVAGRGNVPSLASPMVGRGTELAEATALVRRHRLVTLVGTAGVGKTRLATEVARGEERLGGVWLVRLESAHDEPTVQRAVAEVLSVTRGGDASVVEHLAGTEVLLVLDNCEHVVDDVARVATRYLDAAPRLSLLCTSQVPLGVDGEVLMPIEPLTSDASVELFAQRAGEQRPSLVVDDDAGSAIAEVCLALDGLPLAIELAAARTRSLSIDEIARRLQDRFTLLADPTGRRSERHRALGTAIGWSYDLLFPDDQRGLWALACFADGASLPALEHVLVALDVPAATAVDVLARLADRSLVLADLDGGTARYRLLDSIKAFALGRLADADLADAAGLAHATWFADAASRAAGGVRGPEQGAHLSFVRTERADIDAALAWCASHDPGLGLRTANGFGWAWLVLGDGSAGSERLRRALAAAVEPTGIEHGTNLVLRAWLDSSNDVVSAEADAREAASMAELEGAGRTALAFVLLQQGRAQEALAQLEERPPDEPPWDAAAGHILTAHASLALGDVAAARRACDLAEPMVRALGDDWALDHLESVLGALARAEGRLLDAAQHMERSAEIAGRLGFRTSEAYHRANLGRVLRQAGDTTGAIAALEQAIDIGRETVDLRVVALARARLGEVLLERGDLAAGAEAARAADHWFRSAGAGEGAALAAALVADLDG